MHSNVHGSTIYNRKDMESNLNIPSTEEWKKKMWYIHTTEYSSALKKKGVLSFATAWRKLEDVTLNEISHSRER